LLLLLLMLMPLPLPMPLPLLLLLQSFQEFSFFPCSRAQCRGE
jgi:hypothetical protein